jgi:hypothetical protein
LVTIADFSISKKVRLLTHFFYAQHFFNHDKNNGRVQMSFIVATIKLNLENPGFPYANTPKPKLFQQDVS